jgi:hypothetical protein
MPLAEVNPNIPGYERDAQWRADQLRPFDVGGQKSGTRFTGGNESTHAILYALDPATGDVLYCSIRAAKPSTAGITTAASRFPAAGST